MLSLRRIVTNVVCRRWSSAPLQRNFSTAGGDFGVYTGGKVVPFVSKMEFIQPGSLETFSAFRITSDEGTVLSDSLDPEIPRDECLKIYNDMIRLNNMDKILYEAQRHGRISFYMQNHGEEACTIGSAAGLQPTDMIYGQYREVGALLYRGFTLQQCADQCFSNAGDPARGRQMPVHYGSAELNFQVFLLTFKYLIGSFFDVFAFITITLNITPQIQ